MVLEGTITNGIIVLDRPQALPEGARVEVVVKPTHQEPQSLRELLLEQAGCMTGLPADFAEQHAHYIHGTAKR